MSRKSLLDSISIPAPCPKSWDKMTGNAQSRFCQSCEKTIYNISEMTRYEAQKLLFSSEEKFCIRMEREPDGRIKTLKKQFHQITRQAPIAAGVLSATLALSALTSAQEKDVTGTAGQTVSAKSQKKTSQISFTICDSREAVIPNAEVKLIYQKTKQEFSVKADDDGIAQFNLLPQGRFELIVSNVYGFAEFHKFIQIRRAIEPNIKLFLSVQFSQVMGDFSFEDYETPFFQLILQNDIDEINREISAGFDVKIEDIDKQTALHVAVKHSNLEIVKIIINAGAKIDVRNKAKQTPLLMIGENFGDDTPAIVRLLIIKGSDVNARDKENQTALMFACDEENVEVVKMLLEAGANPNLKDEDGETAFDKTDDKEIKSLLIKFGAKKISK